MKLDAYCFFIIMLLTSCGGKDVETEPSDKGYDYFPLVEGLYREYQVVDERFQVGTIDTSIYFLREELQETVDASDEMQQLVRRYKRTDTLSDWKFDSTWIQAKNEINAFYLENSVRFNKLEFPLFTNKKWDMNAYNTQSDLQSEVRFVGGKYNGFEEVTYIAIDSFFNLVGREHMYEVYKKNVGLVEKHNESLNHQPKADTVGFRIHQKLIKYGQK